MKSPGWTQQERGWWTHPQFGGVVRESKGWAAYYSDQVTLSIGLCKSCKEAMKVCEQQYHANKPAKEVVPTETHAQDNQ